MLMMQQQSFHKAQAVYSGYSMTDPSGKMKPSAPQYNVNQTHLQLIQQELQSSRE
jgi:hypothetical protein